MKGASRLGLRKRYVIGSCALLLAAGFTLNASIAEGASSGADTHLEVQSLDGTGNNLAQPTLGRAGSVYPRVAAAAYADGRSAPLEQPNARFISNRVFNDVNQSVVDDRHLSQWAFVWGELVAHTTSLPDGRGAADNIPFNRGDPLESFRSSSGVIPFARSKAAAGTGVSQPRDQINTVSSYLDASAVYGSTQDRLEWLRTGPVDGNNGNNGALLYLPGGQLPRRDSRANPAAAPPMLTAGRLAGQPNRAAVAGDVRANQSLSSLAVHTLFAREHNRVVAHLPTSLSEEEKFQIARRVVIAEQQYITYHEFLPAMGVRLGAYRGYQPEVDPTITNEFATVGFQLDSMAAGGLEITTDAARFQAPQLAALKAKGVTVKQDVVPGGQVTLVVPFNVASFNPDLLPQLQLGPVLQGLSQEQASSNDEQFDNQLRSVLFQVPTSKDLTCLAGPNLPRCFTSVGDQAATVVERSRDHGMPRYNDMRRAFGLAPKQSFESITGEPSASFPPDPVPTRNVEINDPNSLDFVAVGDRRTPLAARLKAVYGTPDNVDAFVGMLSERHVPGASLGELQLAMWKAQFTASRDGDRFFFLNDPGLKAIKQAYGVDFKNTLADVIAFNTDVPHDRLGNTVFLVPSSANTDAGGQPVAGGPAGSGNAPGNDPADVPAAPTSPPSTRHQRRRRRGMTPGSRR